MLGICSSTIRIVMVRGVWSENSCYSEYMVWLSNSSKLYLKNIKLITEFASWLLSEYLVGTWLVGEDRSKDKEFINSMRKLLWIEWCR